MYENGLNMLHRRLQNRSKVAPRALPLESGNENGDLFYFLFRLLGGYWGSPGALLAAPGAFSLPAGLLLELFGPLF